jgi:hypothetical protein
MTWAELFERAADYDRTTAEIQDALAARRTDE